MCVKVNTTGSTVLCLHFERWIEKFVKPKLEVKGIKNFYSRWRQIVSEAKWKLWLPPNDCPWRLLKVKPIISSTSFHLFIHEVSFCQKTASDILIKTEKTSKLQILTNWKIEKMVLVEGFESSYFGFLSSLNCWI